MNRLLIGMLVAMCSPVVLIGQPNDSESRVGRLVVRMKTPAEIPVIEKEVEALCVSSTPAMCYQGLNDIVSAAAIVIRLDTNALGMRVSERARKLPGLTAAQRFETAQWMGMFHWQRRQYEQAEIVLRQAIAESASQLPAADPVAVSLKITLGLVLRGQVKLDEAAAVYKQVIADIDHVVDHPEETNVRNNLAVVYKDMGVYKEQEELLLEVLRRQEARKAKENAEVVMPLLNLGVLYRSVGRNRDALEPLQRALAIQRAHPALGELNTARALHQLALARMELGHYSEAEEDFRVSLATYAKTAQAGMEKLFATIDLAGLRESQYQHKEADELLQKILVEGRREFGEGDLRLAPVLIALSKLYRRKGEYREAESYGMQAYELCRKRAPGLTDAMGKAKMELGLLRQAQGRLSEAVALFTECLEIQRKILGGEHPSVAAALATLAIANQEAGQGEQAAKQVIEALGIQEKRGRGRVPATAFLWRAAGTILLAQGEYQKAEEYALTAKEIRRGAYGDSHLELGQSSLDLARIYGAQRRYDEATAEVLNALRIYGQALGEEHPFTMSATVTYASLLVRLNRPEEAGAQFQKVIEWMRKKKGELYGAFPDRILEAAAFYLRQGRRQEVEGLIADSLEVLDGLFRVNLLGMDPAQRKQLTVKAAADRDFILHYAFQFAGEGKAMELAAQTSVLFKGLRLQSELETANYMARDGESLRGAFLRRVDLASQRKAAEAFRAEAAKGGAGDLADALAKADARILEIDREDEALQGELRKQTVYRQLTDRVSVQELQSKLKSGEAFLDLVSYRSPNGHEGARYGAIVHRKGAAPLTIDLGPGGAIDALLTEVELMSALEGPDTMWELQRDSSSGQGMTVLRPAQELRGHLVRFQGKLAALYERLLIPIRRKVGEDSYRSIRSWIISPEGKLGRLSWEMLWDRKAGRYLRQEAKVRYAESARTFVLNNEFEATEPPVAFLNPRYGKEEKMAKAGVGSGISAAGAWMGTAVPLYQGQLPLRFTKRYPAGKVYTAGDATERAFRLTSRHEVVIVWTHGRFVEEMSVADELGRIELALAGANEVGRPAEDDGVVTGRDIARLDWRGTKLAAVVGCQTGVATPDGGEGVQGLRRGLYLAGTRNQLLTMWSVAAAPTVRWMELFLDASLRLSYADATDEVQRKFLSGSEVVRDAEGNRLPLHHPLFWAALTISGE